MNFALSDEQETLAETVRRFLEETSPPAEVRRLMEDGNGYDRGVWKQLAGELGLPGVHIPEAYGGQGFGYLELAVVLEQMGRALFPSPYFSTVCLAANAILNAGTEEQKRALLPAIAAGETIATLALVEGPGDWDASGVELAYAREGESVTLSGRKRFVTDGQTADLVIVAARRPQTSGPDGIGLFAVRADAPGVSAAPLDAIDPTRKLADLEFSGVPAEPLGDLDQGAAALAKTLHQAAVALAVECAGGAQACLEAAVEYAKSRVQFARPIGSFQAVKHKCAELLLEVESAKSAAYWASWTAAEDNDELPRAAHLAKAFCCDAYRRAAAESIQIHGGVGFTWEADCHLYYRRAKACETLLGDPVWHRSRLAEQLGF